MTDTTGQRVIHRFSLLILVLALGILYYIVRITGTETLVTNDEPFWLGRSANFYRALVQWEPEHTYQMAHPGVLVMWTGALAYFLHGTAYSAHFDTNMDSPFFIDSRLIAAGINPLEMLQQARYFKLGLESALFVISILMIAVVATRLVAALAGVLIALDPFLAGFGPLMHVDSLVAISLFVASLAIVWASREKQTKLWPWVIAGAIAAVAVLTRTTGVAIAIPLLLAAFTIWRSSGHKKVLQTVGVWVAGFSAVYILGWPALWVQPVETARAMIDWTIGAASDGHENALFFNGEILRGDPGLLFYPVTILWRTTPLVWIGIAILLFSLRSQHVRDRARPFMPVLGLGAAYLLLMTFGAKKFDRYLLPVYPIIALMAAFGFEVLIQNMRSRLRTFAHLIPAVGLAVVALVALIPLSNAGPYRLNYYNEVMRVLERPENAIQIGWFEGSYEAIDFLESEADRLGRPVTAQTFVTPSDGIGPPIRYFVIDQDGPLDSVTFNQTGLTTPEHWYETDYFLFHIQQTQRNMVPQYALFEDAEPVHTIEFGGVTIWEIYAPNQLPLPDSIPDD